MASASKADFDAFVKNIEARIFNLETAVASDRSEKEKKLGELESKVDTGLANSDEVRGRVSALKVEMAGERSEKEASLGELTAAIAASVTSTETKFERLTDNLKKLQEDFESSDPWRGGRGKRADGAGPSPPGGETAKGADSASTTARAAEDGGPERHRIGSDRDQEARKNVWERNGIRDRISKYSNEKEETDFLEMMCDFKKLKKDDGGFLGFLEWLEELQVDVTAKLLEDKAKEPAVAAAGWNIPWMNKQLYGVFCEIAIGKAKSKVVSNKRFVDHNGSLIYRELAREHLSASRSGVVALGTRLTKPTRATIEDFEVRLMQWDLEREQYKMITGNDVGELPLIYLQDMMPEDVCRRYELEKHNTLKVEDLRAFFRRLIDAHKSAPRGKGRGLHDLDAERVGREEPGERLEEHKGEENDDNLWNQLCSFIRRKGRGKGKGAWAATAASRAAGGSGEGGVLEAHWHWHQKEERREEG